MLVVLYIVGFDVVAGVINILVVFVRTLHGLDVVIAICVAVVDVIVVVIDILNMVFGVNLQASVLQGVFIWCLASRQLINLLSSSCTSL